MSSTLFSAVLEKNSKTGCFSIFDQFWYGRVLVERIEGFCSEVEWKRTYCEINEMEEHLANSGTGIFKFWMDIDRKEQFRGFKAREFLLHK